MLKLFKISLKVKLLLVLPLLLFGCAEDAALTSGAQEGNCTFTTTTDVSSSATSSDLRGNCTISDDGNTISFNRTVEETGVSLTASINQSTGEITSNLSGTSTTLRNGTVTVTGKRWEYRQTAGGFTSVFSITLD